VSTQSQPESFLSTRNIIIAVVVIALLLVGYCATRVASLAHTVVDASKGMAARTDTTHHVAPGSAVFLDDAKIADIVNVVVIRADTSPAPPTHGAADSILTAALRQKTVVYSIARPASPALLAQLNDLTLVGQIDGTYDDSVPVQITLSHRAVAPGMPPTQLAVPGRSQPIRVY
jgi:hypothetical protein